MLCDASISASATVLQVVSRTLDANAMPLQMLQLCKCWLMGCQCNASANVTTMQMLAMGCQYKCQCNVTAMQMLAMGCQYKCQCKCHSYANVGYGMPI